MNITGLLAHACPVGNDCPKIHDTDGDDVIVQGDALRLRDPATHARLKFPEGEDGVVVPRELIYGPRLTIGEVGEFIDTRHTFDLLRIENRRAYASASDGGDFARYVHGEGAPLDGGTWLDGLTAERRAGRARRKVHVIIDEQPTDYELYECEWGFARTVAAGEDVRILDSDPGSLLGVPDFLVIDNEHVLVMHYGDDHRFKYARPLTGPDAAVYRALARALWSDAIDFVTWWGQHPDLHRGQAA